MKLPSWQFCWWLLWEWGIISGHNSWITCGDLFRGGRASVKVHQIVANCKATSVAERMRLPGAVHFYYETDGDDFFVFEVASMVNFVKLGCVCVCVCLKHFVLAFQYWILTLTFSKKSRCFLEEMVFEGSWIGVDVSPFCHGGLLQGPCESAGSTHFRTPTTGAIGRPGLFFWVEMWVINKNWDFERWKFGDLRLKILSLWLANISLFGNVASDLLEGQMAPKHFSNSVSWADAANPAGARYPSLIDVRSSWLEQGQQARRAGLKRLAGCLLSLWNNWKKS